MSAIDYKRLSKTVSRALRHAPWEYELELDEAGWTDVEALLEALRAIRPVWSQLQLADLEKMMAEADKQRYELAPGRMRALYGHSVEAKIAKEPAIPPAVLYHGTDPDIVPLILQEGLKPMRRQYVHLSADVQTARQVGQRKAARPVILQVNALEAHHQNHVFYKGNQLVWLADLVPAAFLVVTKL